MINTLHIRPDQPDSSAIYRLAEPTIHEIDSLLSRKLIDTILIEGPPGAGKTTLTRMLTEHFKGGGVDYFHHNGEDECVPRHLRRGTDITNVHEGDVLREMLAVRLFGGGTVGYQRYNPATGDRDIPTLRQLKAPSEQLFVSDGVTTLTESEEFLSRHIPEVRDRVLHILLDEWRETAEERRYNRDVYKKGLPPEVALWRIENQRASIKAYYDSLRTHITITQSTPSCSPKMNCLKAA